MEPVVVLISDCHIGPGEGADNFDCRPEFIGLLRDLDAAHEHIELVLLGDFLDLNAVEDGAADKVAAILEAPANRELFAAVKAFGAKHAVFYVIGNHEVELCWNRALHRSLAGYNIRFPDGMLSYERLLGPGPRKVRLYAEHGNQFDPHCRYTDHFNPLDTPLGSHVNKELYHPIMSLCRDKGSDWLRDLESVRPYEAIPWWIISKYFYFEMNRLLRYVTVPVLLGFITFKIIPLAILWYLIFIRDSISFSYLTAPILLFLAFFVVVDFSLFLVGALIFLVKRDFYRALRRYGLRHTGTYLESRIQGVVAQVLDICRGAAKPNFAAGGPIDVFVYGHFHLASLESVQAGPRTLVAANTGTWVKRVRRIKAHFRLPPVFVGYYNLTYVKAVPGADGVDIQLRRRKKPFTLRLTWLERLAIWGRVPRFEMPEPDVLVKKTSVPYG